MSILRNKIFKITLLVILLIEFLSFFSYLYPVVNKTVFFIIIIATLAASLYKLEYGLLVMFIELMIGSKGYLFYFDAGGFSASIRIALFIIVMSVWLGKKISNIVETHRNASLRKDKFNIGFFKSLHFPYFLVLFIFIVWGLVNGILNENGFGNIFFDFNGWLYFLLVFPVYDVINGVETRLIASLRNIFIVFTASLLWLCLKTFFLLFIFSHSSPDTIYEIYRWVRTSGVGEITQIRGGFSRIFFQSHIFSLIGFFVFLILILNKPRQPKEAKLPIGRLISANTKFFISYLLPFTLLLSAIIVSFSRSFWIGLIASIGFYLLILLLKKDWEKIRRAAAIIFFALIISSFSIIVIVKFPFPEPIGGFNTTDLLSERASNLNESAVVSRWDLLLKLWSKIKEAPISGKGLGATITYKSSDPRALEKNLSGEYTTYAFEWGWLDIWLKLGIGGLLAYIILIGKIFKDGLLRMSNVECRMSNNGLIPGLTIGLAAIFVVNIFTPYLNHPLGIGYLLLVSMLINSQK